MDIPTKVIADYLEDKLKRNTQTMNDILKDILQSFGELKK
jgi:hypothetical protein